MSWRLLFLCWENFHDEDTIMKNCKILDIIVMGTITGAPLLPFVSWSLKHEV